MKTKKLFAALAVAAALTATILSCSGGGGGSGGGSVTPTPTGFYPASGMTKLQSASASAEPIALLPDTKTLAISGVKGKKIYMARTNMRDSVLENANQRVLDVPASASRPAEFDALNGAEFFSQKKDARQIFEENMLKRLEEELAAKPKRISKNASQIQASAVIDYALGDTEKFTAMDPEAETQTMKTLEFKLIVKEEKYNIWVDVNDQTYANNQSDFVTNAADVGIKFINGYELVSHIYGVPSDKLYNKNYSEYGDMAEVSKTGTKINILLFSMQKKHDLNGYVTLDDFYPKQANSLSNEGRFLYLDSSNIINDLQTAYTTSLHEFSHYISRTKKYFEYRKEWSYWYGEIMAMLCEDMMQQYLGVDDSDVNDPGKMHSTPKDRLATANAGDIFNGSNGREGPVYAWGFMFGAWLSRNYGGIKFIKELATNNAVDMESIIAAVKTAGGKDYDEKTLLRDFAEALFEEKAGFGLNKDGDTEPTNSEYSKDYTDSKGEHHYEYKVTAINLWDPFYAWYDVSNINSLVNNATIAVADLPAANNYKKTWKGVTPEKAFKGPALFMNGTCCCRLGPRGSAILFVGAPQEDAITLNFKCKGGESFADEIFIWVK